MKKSLEILWQLEHLEIEKKKLVAQKSSLSTDLMRAAWNSMQDMSKLLEEKKKVLRKKQQDASNLEVQLENISLQIKQSEAKLYGGNIKYSKELAQAKNVYDTHKQQCSQLEDELLTLLGCNEDLESEIKCMTQEVEKKRIEHLDKQKQHAAEVQSMETKIKELDERIDSLAFQVETETLAKYRALNRKMSMPVAKVENGICTGCRMCIPTGKTMMKQDSIIYCDSCGRILIV